MIDLSNKLALLIDDLAEMRNTVRIQLADCGITQCEMARNIKEAVDKISLRRFDLIVCDYNLGQGADGQQLLELVRRRKLLSPSAVFLMITGETGYEKVSTAAEYSPDDYLLKPFTSQTMHARLERALEKKAALHPILRHLGERGSREKALDACDALLKEAPRYAADIQRLKGSILIELGRFQPALELYDSVLATRATPWAEVGRARALIALGRDDDAKENLARTLDAYPNYLAAYDTLAEVTAKTDKFAAQQIVEQALKVAPSTQRQRQMGALAMGNGDFSRAESAYRRAVEKDRTGFFKSPDDYAGLAKSCSEMGKSTEALAAVKEMSHHFTRSPDLEARQAAVESLVQAKAGNVVAAQAALQRALAVQPENGLDASTALEVANACFAGGQPDKAKAIIQAVAEDHHEDEGVLQQAQAVFTSAGLGDEGSAILASTKKRMIALNNDAVAMAKAGQLEKASAMLEEAADRLLNNCQVSINAAIAALMRIQRDGPDPELVAKAHRYIAQAIHANPAHARVPEALNLYRRLAPADAPSLSVPGEGEA